MNNISYQAWVLCYKKRQDSLDLIDTRCIGISKDKDEAINCAKAFCATFTKKLAKKLMPNANYFEVQVETVEAHEKYEENIDTVFEEVIEF